METGPALQGKANSKVERANVESSKIDQIILGTAKTGLEGLDQRVLGTAKTGLEGLDQRVLGTAKTGYHQ